MSQHDRARDYAALFRPGLVHRDLYVDEGIFRQEMDILFGSTWVYVAHESEIPAPGDYVTRRIGRRPVIVTRDSDGGLNVLMNRCPHRGATLCRDDRGNAATITCPYHAWAFDPKGGCTAVPARPGFGADVDLARFDMGRAAQVESYRGFIFAAMKPVPPLVEHLAGAAGILDAWLDRNPGHPIRVQSGSMPFEVRSNWKAVYDNAADGYHVLFSHESMLRVFAQRYGDVDMAYYHGDFDASALFVKDLGNGHTLLDQRAEMHALSAWKRQHVLPGREILWEQLNAALGEEQALDLLDGSTGSGINLNIFPNLLIIGNQIQVLEPVSANTCVINWYATTLDGVPDEINAIRMRMQEDFPSFGEVDDAANFEACQVGLEEIPEMEWVNIARHIDGARRYRDSDGHWREPISSDLHPRAYWAAWRALMDPSAESKEKAA